MCWSGCLLLFLFCFVCLLRARSRSLLTEVPSYPPVGCRACTVWCRAHGSRVSLQLRFVSLKSAATMPLPLPYACACETLCPRCCAHAAAHPECARHDQANLGVCLRAKFCFHLWTVGQYTKQKWAPNRITSAGSPWRGLGRPVRAGGGAVKTYMYGTWVTIQKGTLSLTVKVQVPTRDRRVG